MIKNLALTIFMLTCVLFAPTSAQTAAPSEKQAALNELVALFNADNKMEDIMNAITAQMQTSLDASAKGMLDERTDLTAAEKQSLEAALTDDRRFSVKRFQDKLMRVLDIDKLATDITSALLDKYYTLDEIKDLNAFYKTATGQKILKLMTPMMIESQQLMQAQMMPKMQIVIKEIMDEDRAAVEKTINAVKPKPKKTRGR